MNKSRPQDAILSLPSSWLSPDEKSLAQEILFTDKEKKALARFRDQNLKMLSGAKVVIIDLRKPNGFLGDTIRQSFLTQALAQRYPSKLILEWSCHPELLNRNKTIIALVEMNGQIVIQYQLSPDGPLKKVTSNLREIVKIVPGFNSFSTVSFLTQTPKAISIPPLPFHQLHAAQIFWDILYDIKELNPPLQTSVGFSYNDQRKAKEIFAQLKVNQNTFSFIIHPDAYNLHFEEKKWPVSKWVSLIENLNEFGQVFLTQGVNHPKISQEIAKKCQQRKISLTPFPLVSLPQYAALLQCFPKKKTILIGLESMAATHLAPSLGLKTVVIAAGKLFNPAVYGPFGGTVVHNQEKTATSIKVKRVVEAVKNNLNFSS